MLHLLSFLPRTLATSALAVLTVMLLAAGLAQPALAANSRDAVTLDFVNADIEAVARTMATISGRNVVVDPRVQGTMTLTSTQPVTADEAIRLFTTQLRVQGFSLVDSNGIYLVVPEAEAKLQGGSVLAGKAGGGQIQTRIFRLVHVDAENLVPVLRPLISPNNTINVDPGGNALVITDYGDNLQRLGRIISALDVSEATNLEIVRLEHAVASDLVPLVNQLLRGGAGAAPADSRGSQQGAQQAALQQGSGYRTTLVAEPRSNAVIVRAANPARLMQARSLIRQLDMAPAGGEGSSSGNIHVVYLKNADATRLAQTLRAALASLPEAAARGDAPTSGGDGGNAGSSMPGRGLSSAASSMGASTSGGLDGGPTIDTGASNQPSTGGQIQADPATNSLIISAPEPVYRQLRGVIDKLDERRAQVYVESLIAEVRQDKMAEFGIQWQGILGRKGDTNIGIGGTNFNAGSANIIDLTAQFAGMGSSDWQPSTPLSGGLNLGLLHRFGDRYALSALANFLQSSGTGNVLSAPTLLTLDNEEARIVVGQNVPLITGSYTNTGSNTNTVNPFQTYERTDVGLTLRVRPQISEDGTIKLVLYQETSSVVAESVNSPQGLITNKRAIESTVLVDDGAIIALGGLMEDEFSSGVDKVPGLGDIPVLGNLFRSENRSYVKTNLMVFLRPVIMRDAAATEAFSLSRYDYMRAAQTANQPAPSNLLQVNQAPVIPEVTPVNPQAWTRPAPPAPLAPTLDGINPASLQSQSTSGFQMPAAGENNYYGD